MGTVSSKKPKQKDVEDVVRIYLEQNEIDGQVVCKWRYDNVLIVTIDLPAGIYNEKEIENELIILIDKYFYYFPFSIYIIANESFF